MNPMKKGLRLAGETPAGHQQGRLQWCCTSDWIWGENRVSGGLGGLESDSVSEVLELADEAAGLLLGVVAAVEVAGAEFGVGDVAVEDRVGCEQDRVTGGA